MASNSINPTSQLQPTPPPPSPPPPPPVTDIFLGRNVNSSNDGVVDTHVHRTVHKIRVSALAHNYGEVESAANRQRCSVIVVVKADGYGHGAIATALFLADTVGADAFAVATLEEAVALRRAFQQTATAARQVGGVDLNRLGSTVDVGGRGGSRTGNTTSSAATVASGAGDDCTVMSTMASYATNGRNGNGRRRSLRQTHIRILVLGPPVGFPRCFDDYHHHNIEVMISGPEVARALLEWVCNEDERKRTLVERVAAESKERILLEQPHHDNNGTSNGIGPGLNMPLRGAKPKRTDLLDSGRDHCACDGSDVSLAGDAISQTSSRSGGTPQQQPPQYHPPSATLGNVTGSDLAREVREILKNQKMLADSQQIMNHQQKQQQIAGPTHSRKPSGSSTPLSAMTFTPVSSSHDLAKTAVSATGPDANGCHSDGDATANMTASTASTKPSNATTTMPATGLAAIPTGPVRVFAGIEEAAKHSRTRHKAIASEVFYDHGDDDDDDEGCNGRAESDASTTFESKSLVDAANSLDPHNVQAGYADGGDSLLLNMDVLSCNTKGPTTRSTNTVGTKSSSRSRVNIPTNINPSALPLMVPARKRLRWHAVIDSGMGRLGFRPDPVSKEEQGKRRDSVDIIKELVDLEIKRDCPIEFFGMCTHMADANSTSTYTHQQMNKFKGLLKRVRAVGVSVPTISTDNSAALLTTNLTHFDAKELLTQADSDSRGFVRTGGAIYGQRPNFKQLQAVSTLMASVRHVAILKEGESVGYDRAYVAPKNVRIGTLTIGFADGYPRELGNGIGKVSIRGHLFPVAGNVCMDMLMVELGPAGDKKGAGAQVVVGDTAILWGPDPDGEDGEGHVRLQDLATALKTTQSALTCGLKKERVLRHYA